MITVLLWAAALFVAAGFAFIAALCAGRWALAAFFASAAAAITAGTWLAITAYLNGTL